MTGPQGGRAGGVVELDGIWRMAMRHSPLGMTVAAADGQLLFANPAFCDLVGRNEQDLISRSFTEITHPADREASQRDFARTAAGEQDFFRVEKRYLHSDGSVIWGDVSVVLVRDDDHRPQYLVAQVVDMTAQQRDRLALARAIESVEHERSMGIAILDSVDVGLVLIDSDGVYERMNRQHHAFLALAYPDGHHERAGQIGLVYAADGSTVLTRDQLPSVRAVGGEEFDDYRIWVGDDPFTRRALAVSARSVRTGAGAFVGGALAYVDVTILLSTLQVQQTFLGVVSHELRTPLTSILGHLELLAELESVPDVVRRPLAVIHRNATRLERLVTDLLQETQLRSDGVVLERRESDLGVLASEAVESVSLSAAEAGLQLTIETTGSLVCVVDPERVRQVLDNLLTNAVKYTDAGGRVDVCCRPVPGAEHQLEVTVSDSGIGIPADDLAHLFIPFFRSSQALSRQTNGLGLGLGIVKAIVDAHGGQVHVDSEPGRGTTVRLQLPTLLPSGPDAAAP